MKRETLTSVLYYTLITICILGTVVVLLHIVLPDGFFLVNSILERPFFTIDANITDFHIVVLSILTVASWLIYAVSLVTCFMFPYTWDIIYDSLYFLYPERKVVKTPETKICSTTPATVCDGNSDLNTNVSYYKSTITGLPHVARVISGTEGRTVYVYNLVTGDCKRMSEIDFYENQKV